MKYKAILIDDEVWALSDLLTSVEWSAHGFEIVKTYTSPIEALQEIKEISPLIIFTDILMPNMSGLEFIQAAKALLPDCIFVIISAYADFKYARTAMKLGVTDYILKPINVEDINEILDSIKLKLLPSDQIPPVNDEKFAKILEYISEHYSEKITLQSISNTFFFSKNYICYMFQKKLSVTFSQYLNSVRIENAKRLLKTTSFSLFEIAQKVGYSDGFYFNRVFSSYENMSPNTYRKRCLGGIIIER